jgi:hypothetical protein
MPKKVAATAAKALTAPRLKGAKAKAAEAKVPWSV